MQLIHSAPPMQVIIAGAAIQFLVAGTTNQDVISILSIKNNSMLASIKKIIGSIAYRPCIGEHRFTQEHIHGFLFTIREHDIAYSAAQCIPDINIIRRAIFQNHIQRTAYPRCRNTRAGHS